MVMSGVQCAGTESRLIDCHHTPGVPPGGHGFPVSLGCSSTRKLKEATLSLMYTCRALCTKSGVPSKTHKSITFKYIGIAEYSVERVSLV